MWLAAAFFIGTGVACAGHGSIRTPSIQTRSFEQQASPARIAVEPNRESSPESANLVSNYCVTCHNDRFKTAGLSLQGLELAYVPQDARVWEKVARKLRSGEMPPATVRSRPDPRLAGELATYLETTLDRAARSEERRVGKERGCKGRQINTKK